MNGSENESIKKDELIGHVVKAILVHDQIFHVLDEYLTRLISCKSSLLRIRNPHSFKISQIVTPLIPNFTYILTRYIALG